MHPAFSVIFFTTASGAGYGLLVWLGVFGAAGVLPADRGFGLAAFGTAYALVTAGLLSSTFHLGHPERAWRALTQWRSSWLSREGIMAILTYVPTGIHAIGWVLLERNDGAFAAAGLVGALLALFTIYCTAMIYASLKSIHRWANGFVPPAYLTLGLATGAVPLSLLTHAFGIADVAVDAAALVAVAIAGAVKAGYWRYISGNSGESSVASATGLGRPGIVRLLEAPHTESNYLLQEMGYRVARKHAARLRIVAALTLFAGPLAALLAVVASGASAATTILLAAGTLSAVMGVLVERWLFFAEAKHTVTLYYGEETA